MSLSNPQIDAPVDLRYARQVLLPQLGAAGQRKLAGSRILLIGCGALGGTIADQLVRAGVGFLRIVDRDIVESSNLHRQTLFDEADAREGLPKAVAAARRLRAINSGIVIEERIADIHAGNIEGFTTRWPLAADGRPPTADLILDGTDNAETRFLVNDLCVKLALPWVYGACVGTEGRVMLIRPGGPCLRCIFPAMPGPGELPTCDTVGVLGSAAALVASLQAAAAIRWLTDRSSADQLLVLDAWSSRFRTVDVSHARRADCRCCGQRHFDYLDSISPGATTSLCGRDAVQVRPAADAAIDMDALAARLASSGAIERTPYLLRCRLIDPAGLQLTVFPDGRAIVHGTTEPARARSIVARYVGA